MPCIDELGNVCYYKVSVRLYSIARPSVAEFTALKNAQRVYGQYGICISFVSGQSVLLPAIDQIQLQTINGDCGWDITSDDQKTLHGIRKNYSGSAFEISVYFVNEIRENDARQLNGCGGHAPGRPALTVAASGTPWTFAHELGHVLLGKHFKPVHMEADTTNIMYKSTSGIISDPPTLNALQLAAIKSSLYCRVCEENMTPIDWQTRRPRKNVDFFFK
jgi:hypothetical protein